MHGGQAQFGFNYDDSNQPTGSASFSDSGSGVNFQTTQIAAAAFNQVAHTVTLTGSGTDNGRAVTFTIVAADSSLAPPGLFGITLTDGYTTAATSWMEALPSIKGKSRQHCEAGLDPVSQFF
jgi:hypothetical protein